MPGKEGRDISRWALKHPETRLRTWRDSWRKWQENLTFMGQELREALTIRLATEMDQLAIRAMIRSERLNPTGLDWPSFMVATDERGLAGAVQLRRHRDGSRELGTLVVRKQARGHGIAGKLIDALGRSQDRSGRRLLGPLTT